MCLEYHISIISLAEANIIQGFQQLTEGTGYIR
jgi:hypothetical protein